VFTQNKSQHCLKNNVQKRGNRRGIIRYFCNDCNVSFSSKRRPKNLQEIIFKKYVYKRQILKDLANEYDRSIPWIRNQILEYEAVEKAHNPRPIVIVCDATFYGKRKDKLGTLVFKDILQNEVLIWKHIDSELISDYKQLEVQLVKLGYKIQAIIIDGKRGLYNAFKDYPIQMCHFHQRQTINRYLTRKPKLEASKDLQKIMYNLTTTNQNNFTKKLDEWHIKYKEFLDEKSISSTTGKLNYTHLRVRSAYRSLITNLPYLFTYKYYKKITIHNTTNSIDGGVFSPMKKLLKIHNGFTKSLKLKMVDDYLVNYKKK
jgi:hypothetical protein